MPTTLKQQYESRKLNELHERLVKIDKKILHESLLVEKFDKELIRQGAKHLKSLSAINFPTASLKNAQRLAITDIRKGLSGSQKTGVIRGIINLFKKEKENPFVDALAFASAMEELAEVGPDILSVWPEGEEFTGEEAKSARDLILKGLKPKGWGENWVSKYLPGGLEKAVNELITADKAEIKQFINDIQQLRGSADIGERVVAAAQQPTTGTTPTEPATSGTDKSAIEPTASSDKKPSAVAKKELDPEFVAAYARKLPDIDEKIVAKVIHALHAGGQLKLK